LVKPFQVYNSNQQLRVTNLPFRSSTFSSDSCFFEVNMFVPKFVSERIQQTWNAFDKTNACQLSIFDLPFVQLRAYFIHLGSTCTDILWFYMKVKTFLELALVKTTSGPGSIIIISRRYMISAFEII